jgi:integrase/recombinase XerD
MDIPTLPAGQKAVSRSFPTLIDQFLKSHDVKPITREGYERRLRQFFSWCTANHITDANRDTIIDYKRTLISKGFTAYSVSGYLVAVRQFFVWTEMVKVHPNVARGVKGRRRQKGFCRDAFSVEQVQTLLGSIDRSTLIGKRDYALLNLLARTGIRTIELVRADVGDIRQVGGETILMLQGKGSDSKDEIVVLVNNSLQPIMDYILARGDSNAAAPLFGSLSDGNWGERICTRTVRRIVKTRLRLTGTESSRLTAHSFRHFLVTTALQNGVSLQETQQAARHASLQSTMLYAQNLRRTCGVAEKKVDEVLSGD